MFNYTLHAYTTLLQFTTHIYSIHTIHTTHPQTHIYTKHMHISHTYTQSDLKQLGRRSEEFNYYKTSDT